MGETDNAPLRLEEAARVAFPGGGMTVSGLRRERDRGTLEVFRIAGKDFTTLAAVQRMLDRCRVHPREYAYTLEQPKMIGVRHGSSETGPNLPEQALALKIENRLKQLSPPTSRPDTKRPATNVVSMK